MNATRRARIIGRFDGKCADCSGPGPFIIDHPAILWMGAPDEDEDCRPLCATCDGKKTPGDLKRIAKVKRIIAREDGTRRPRKPIPSRPMSKTNRPIPSRPFPKRQKDRKR